LTTSPGITPRWLPRKEAMAYLGIGSRRTFREKVEPHLRKAAIPGTSMVRFDRESIDRFMAQGELADEEERRIIDKLAGVRV
jgi:hypothetical protein